MSPVELVEFRKQLDNYLSKGWIRPSTLHYGASIFFAKIKDRNLEMCIDKKDLDQKKRPDKYPLPRIADLLDQLVDTKHLRGINLYNGYH